MIDTKKEVVAHVETADSKVVAMCCGWQVPHSRFSMANDHEVYDSDHSTRGKSSGAHARLLVLI